MSKVLKWIVNIILLVAIIVAAGLLIPPFFGVDTVIVDDVDMDTNLPKGSVTYGVKKGLKELEVGDEVLLSVDEGKYIFRLKNIDTATGTTTLLDEKSADSEEKEEVFREKITKVMFAVPFVGYIVMAMKSTEGLIIIGLAVIFVIVLFILAELWKRDDDEEEEEEEEFFEDEDTLPPPARVDVPAQIMEEVSSEIASAVSSVMAEEAGSMMEESDQEESAEDEKSEEKVLSCDVGADEKDNQITVPEEMQVPQEECLEEERQGIELAMPVYTAEELVQKAKEAGEEPQVRQDDKTQVTILDYSDIL
jgi:hypothetical protein